MAWAGRGEGEEFVTGFRGRAALVSSAEGGRGDCVNGREGENGVGDWVRDGGGEGRNALSVLRLRVRVWRCVSRCVRAGRTG